MCDVAAEAVVMNGYAAKCIVINKDVRRLHATKPPDGTEPDLEQKANLCIYEVPSPGHAFALHRSLPHAAAASVCMHPVAMELDLVGKSFAEGKTTCVQVFDSGLIGEGVLHMLLWAKEKLLTDDVVLVSPKEEHHNTEESRPPLRY